MPKLRLIFGIPAIVLLFLPYTSDTSPWDAVFGTGLGTDIALLGGPFFLAVPILVAEAQIVLKKSLPKTERAVCRILAYAALACGLVVMLETIRDSSFDKSSIRALLAFSIPLVLAVISIFLARRLDAEKGAVTAMKAAWLPNAILCGIAFWAEGGWQIGAYLAALTIILYAVEIALFLIKREHWSGLSK